MKAMIVSPITGAAGNVEFLIYARCRRDSAITDYMQPELQAMIRSVVVEATDRVS